MRNCFRNHLHSILFRIFTICTIISLNCNLIFASSTVGQLNQSVSFDFLSIASFKASSNAYFSNTQADATYLTTASLLGSFINTFGPKYSYQISSFVQGTPATYIESKDVNVHLRDISTNQWYINDNIMRIRDYMGPISQVVSDIKTNTTNTAAATNAALTLMGDQVNIDWVNMSISSINAATSTQNAFNQTYITSAQLVGTDIYLRIDLGSNPNYNSILKFVLPIIPYNSTSDFVLADVYIMNSVNSGWAYIASPNTKLVGNTSNNTSTVYYDGFIRSYAGANISNKILLHIKSNQSIYYLYNNRSQASVSYITTDKVDYHTVYDTYLLEQIKDKEMTADVTVDINDSVNVTPILLDVDIGIDDFSTVNTVSNKLRTWLTTGVSVSALIGALDDLDDSFFTLSNRNTIETINNQYTNFYD